MRKRNRRINVRLSKDEYEYLNGLVEETQLSREEYLRVLINCVKAEKTIDEELTDVLKNLYIIANNMNQIAHEANSTGFVDSEKYKENIKKLNYEVSNILDLFGKPIEFE